MNLIVGATGLLGGEICRRLAAQGKPLRALVRTSSQPEKLEALRHLGVELVTGDLKDADSLHPASAGAAAVISTASTTASRQQGDSIPAVDQDGQLALVDAARDAGVRHFVYISYSGQIDDEDPSPLTRAKRTVEERIRSSGMTYTILRPSVFMEVWLSPHLGFDYPNGKATIYGTGENPISWISLGDVAEFAVRSLGNPAARNAVLELGGPAAVSPNDVVRTFEQVGGRTFDVQHVPGDALRAQRAAARNPLEQSFAALMLAYAKGDPIDMGGALEKFPVQLTSVRDYAERVLRV
jgi:uncharacterized protein YbjT (DUF2867 family)